MSNNLTFRFVSNQELAEKFEWVVTGTWSRVLAAFMPNRILYNSENMVLNYSN